MMRVLQLPSEDPVPAVHKSYKHKTGMVETHTPVFPMLPLDQMCADCMTSIADKQTWKPYKTWELSYY